MKEPGLILSSLIWNGEADMPNKYFKIQNPGDQCHGSDGRGTYADTCGRAE